MYLFRESVDGFRSSGSFGCQSDRKPSGPGKVSYLVYPDFETNPHPALLRSIKLSLRTRELDCYDYATSTNPPILHRKETVLPPGHELMAKFARLTRQEEKHGLLDDTATIGTREGWERRLAERGFTVRGHRLVRQRDEKGGSGTTKLTKQTKRREDAESRMSRAIVGVRSRHHDCQYKLERNPVPPPPSPGTARNHLGQIGRPRLLCDAK